MAGVIQLQRQLLDYTTSLYNEAYLDGQFKQLRQLQDESNPDFVVQTVSLFFEDSERLLNELTATLNGKTVDFKGVYDHVYQLTGCSSSIGAQRVKRACIMFHTYCKQQNIEGCLKSLQLLKNEFFVVKDKLETLFKLEQQLVATVDQFLCSEMTMKHIIV